MKFNEKATRTAKKPVQDINMTQSIAEFPNDDSEADLLGSSKRWL